MSIATSRSQVLALYRNIVKLGEQLSLPFISFFSIKPLVSGKTWKAKDVERTSVERQDILTEARQSFRANRNVSDPKKIAELVFEGEKRLVQAQHYGIPYARPEYVHPQTAYSEF
ncbi:unnamed protein product [Nippostrongylus brasiliensis]|uniref:Complex1_LYR_dom domain-containing protein n=1 Tax=Nippostrongylus brasiliensis TaxID=27835 RepID=A0A0N4YMG3_NIPBR|nr:unnamed protein product [Nippostrongylus brasiliensis]